MDTKKTQAPKPATKTPGTAGSVAKDATKHIVKGMKDGESESHSSMADENSLPKTGGESIKNAATKHVKSGLKGGDMKSQNTVSNPSVKKPGLKEDEVVKNAATKHVLNGIKAGEGHTVNMHKTSTVSNPGEEKMANSTSGTVTKQETRAPKPTESKPEEMKMASKTGGTATKQETVAPKPKESKPAEEKKAAPSAKGSTEVGGKKSGLPNMKEGDSFMKMRAGKDGKVYEEGYLPTDETWMNEEPGMDMSDMHHDMHEMGMDHMHTEGEPCDECGMYEDDDQMMESEEEEEGDDEETKALNEQIARMKQILRY
jgi:hypothetical protein